MAAVSFTKFTDLNTAILAEINSYGDVYSQFPAVCKKCYQVSLLPGSATYKHHVLVQNLLAASAVTPTLTPLPNYSFSVQQWNALRTAFNKNLTNEEVDDWCKANQLSAEQFHLLKAFEAQPFSGAVHCGNISALFGIVGLNPQEVVQSERYAVCIQHFSNCAYIIDKMTLTLFRKVTLEVDNFNGTVIPPQTESDPLLMIFFQMGTKLNIYTPAKNEDGSIREMKAVTITLKHRSFGDAPRVIVKYQSSFFMVAFIPSNSSSYVLCLNSDKLQAQKKLFFNSRIVDLCIYEEYALVATESNGIFYFRIKDINPLQTNDIPEGTQIVAPEFLHERQYHFQLDSGRLYIHFKNAEEDAYNMRAMLDFPSGKKIKLTSGHFTLHTTLLREYFSVDKYQDRIELLSLKNGTRIRFPSHVMLGDERWTPEFRAFIIRSKEKEVWIATERGVLKYCTPTNFMAQGPNVLAQIEQKSAASKRQKV